MTDTGALPGGSEVPEAFPGSSDHVLARQAVPRTAGEARERVTALLDAAFSDLKNEDLDVVVADALLVTSELVTNAMRHGRGLTGFRAELVDDGLRLDVEDASPEEPATQVSSASDAFPPGGFGWPLVCRLARHVAVTPRPGGKQITVLVPLM
ncbi:ATP-binding protein [Streptomyces sp. HB132]|uniref:ATP-binding protein n=1 Tax=Streptomyces sp. HB132 TaxID=767388 RepID=UPI0019615D25|nr:ATP-binding protein [Streptomyces sp. HB132]MBM7439533.1 anti-sigma regulatory factor (Ser/Thr protein kinase) [Streptomyces sp. HB132]